MTPNSSKLIDGPEDSPEKVVEGQPSTKSRPDPERVSPSQRGRFLSAMDEKESKKGSTVTKKEKAAEKKGGNLFNLFSSAESKKEGALGDALESNVGGGDAYEEPIEPIDPTLHKQKKQFSISKEQELLAAQSIAEKEAGKKNLAPLYTPQKAPQKKVVSLEKTTKEPQLPPEETTLTPSDKPKQIPVDSSMHPSPEGNKKAPSDSPKPFYANYVDVKTTDLPKEIQEKPKPIYAEYLGVKTTEPLKGTKVDIESAEAQKKTILPPVQGFLPPQQSVIGGKTIAELNQEHRAELLEVFHQAIDAIRVLKTKAESIITISVKYPPTFEGATIKIVESTMAKNEFNITFANLSPEARRIIESLANQAQLQNSFISKGYTLRNISIAPELRFGLAVAPITPTASSDDRPSKEGGSNQEFGQNESSKEQANK